MIEHAIVACKGIPNLKSVFLLGFYEEREFTIFTSRISAEIGCPVRYLKEPKGLGSAGGLHAFRDTLVEDSPSYVIVINGDVCSSFPLEGAGAFDAIRGGTRRQNHSVGPTITT
jgi:mannose-1-phosphate guanylyltransferase